jgi:hypothetical protein
MFDDDTLKRLREIGALTSRARQELGAAIEPLAAQLIEFQRQQQRVAVGLAAALAPLRQWGDQFAELQPVLRRAAEVLAQLPEGTRRAQDMAASRGWYLAVWGHSFRESAELVALAQRGDNLAVELWLADRTRTGLNGIRQGVLAAFPPRSAILEQAFDAHDRRQFAVSIPAMLAQADGVHFDLVNQHLFRKNSRERLRKRLSSMLRGDGTQPTASIAFLFLRPLVELNALDKTVRMPVDPFNRHDVLHGTDLGYATELNSLRVIALLDFLSWVKVDLTDEAA